MPTNDNVSVPWQDLDSRRASFIDATCIPSGLTTLKPSSMPLQDVYAFYSHIIKIQDSNQAFKFKDDCGSLHSPSTPAPAISGLTVEQKEDTPTRGLQDDTIQVSDNSQLGLVVGIDADSRTPEYDGASENTPENAHEAIVDVGGGDVEVARPNITCVFEDMCCLLSNSCFIGNTIANVLTLNVEVQAAPPSVRQME
jgi:hypothetical protein